MGTCKKMLSWILSICLMFTMLTGLEVTEVQAEGGPLDALTLPYSETNAVYGNITLPQATENGTAITWSAEPKGIIDVESHENAGYDPTLAGTVTRPDKDTIVKLTAKLGTAGNVTKEFSVLVKAAPKQQEELTSYLFAHFTGVEKKGTDEQIYFALSKDGDQWKDMTKDEDPILVSDVGEGGARDPFILRSAEGDKFYLLATDLSVYNRDGNWDGTVTSASTKMVVWESTDLLDWGKARLVDIAGSIPGAGCMWAPEAVYDEKTGEYVVFWATYSEDSNDKGDGQNVYYAKTRDFYTFTEPVKWIDTEDAVLDTTMIQANGKWYRASAADGEIRIDESDSIFGEWKVLSTLRSIFNNNKYSGTYLEGPELFQYCEDDWLTGEDGEPVPTWGLMCDQFKEKNGYLPFKTTNLSDVTAASWQPATNVSFGDLKKRHGSILALTDEEYERVAEAFEDELITIPKVENLPEDFIHGIDVSTYLSEIQSGVKYYNEDDEEENMFQIFKDAGVNYVRLRVWNCPYRVEREADGSVMKVDGKIQYLYVDEDGNEYKEDEVITTRNPEGYNEYKLANGEPVYREGYGAGNCDLDAAIQTGKIATQYGMKVLVDFHYSDFWADPAKLTVPKEWEGMTIEEKGDALYNYTKDSLEQLIDAGVDVGMVQVGNEITGGMAGEKDRSKINDMVKKGSQAVREVSTEKGKEIAVAVHYTNPDRSNYLQNFAKGLKDAGVDYDVFATSYYPFWHGTLQNLNNVLSTIASTYKKKVMIAEISYPTTGEDGDGWRNVVGGKNSMSSLPLNYSVDKNGQGQALAIRDAIETIANIEGGIGTFYWEPAWIPVKNYAGAANDEKEEVLSYNADKWEKYGSGWASKYSGPVSGGGDGYDEEVSEDINKHGSEWDNQAFFDFDGHALPSINVYRAVYTGSIKKPVTVDSVEEPSYSMKYQDVPQLPATVDVKLSNGTTVKGVIVHWNETELASLRNASPGEHIVHGSLGTFRYRSNRETITVPEGEQKTICRVVVTPKQETEISESYVGQTFTSGDLVYKVTVYSEKTKSVTVTGAAKQLTKVTVPDTVVYKNMTFEVTAIGDNALANQQNLTDVVIGKNVSDIGAKAFYNDKKLKKVTFKGTAVNKIGKDAFKNINKKASFVTQKTFTYKNLKYKITKCTASANDVTVTGADKQLTSVTIPATVTYNGMTFKVTAVGKKAFRNQKKLKSAVIGKNIKTIEQEAFSGAKKLAKIKFNGTAVKTIGKNAFKNIKKSAVFTVKKPKRASYKKLLQKAKTKNFTVK